MVIKSVSIVKYNLSYTNSVIIPEIAIIISCPAGSDFAEMPRARPRILLSDQTPSSTSVRERRVKRTLEFGETEQQGNAMTF